MVGEIFVYFLCKFGAVRAAGQEQVKIADAVMKKLKLGPTFIQVKGAYSGKEKRIFTAIANYFPITQKIT